MKYLIKKCLGLKKPNPDSLVLVSPPLNPADLVTEELRRLRYFYNLDRVKFYDGLVPIDNLIVSLTSYGSRILHVHEVIESLLSQTIRPEKIILWLSKDEFSKSNLPPNLIAQTERGLTVEFCPDIKSYKKLIYAWSEYPNAAIVTADDDIIYPDFWLESLYQAYQKEPDYIHCHRMHLMTKTVFGKLKPYAKWELVCQDSAASVNVFPTTGGGVLYPPNSLHKKVTDQAKFNQLCPGADDVWFKSMALLQGTLCKRVASNCWSLALDISSLSQEVSLYHKNINNNDRQLQAVFSAYNINI